MSHHRVAENVPKGPRTERKDLVRALGYCSCLSGLGGYLRRRGCDTVMEHSDEKETDMAEYVTRRNFMTLLAATAAAGTLGSRKKHDS